MSRFRFVHTADLHLDSPFRGIARRDPQIAEVLVNATLKAFDRVVTLCQDEQVDFLLVAGDAFDAAERSLRAERAFAEGLATLSRTGLQCFVVHGNHDPLGDSVPSGLPEKVHVFGAEPGSVPVTREGTEIARVYGVSYPVPAVTDNLARRISRDPQTPFAIGLLHANVGGRSDHEPYAPCTPADLVSAGMNYWALGHIHAREVVREREPTIVYPGNTQGRNPRETGPRGCYLVDVDGERVGLRFVETDVVRWERVEVKIDGVDDERDLTRRIEESVGGVMEEAGGRPVIARLVLLGRGEMHHRLVKPGLLRGYLTDIEQAMSRDGQFVLIESEEVRSGPPVDLELLRDEPSVLGEFVRISEAARSEEHVRRIIRETLAPLEEKLAEAGVPLDLSEPDLTDLADRAGMLGIDYLSGEIE